MALAVAGEAGPVIRAVPYLVAAGIYSLFHIYPTLRNRRLVRWLHGAEQRTLRP
jgi:hypothetical protein